MTFQTSNYTLTNLQSAINDKVDDSVAQETVVRAAREGVKIYAKFERRLLPERAKLHTGALSIGSAGLSLTLIGLDALTAWVTATAYVVGDVVKNSNVGYQCVEAHTSGTFSTDLSAGKWEIYRPFMGTREPYKVYRSNSSGEWSEFDEYPKGNKGAAYTCVYIENNTLFIYPDLTESVDIVIEYRKAPVLPSANTINMAQTLPIEFEAEDMFEEFVLARFFRTEGTQISSQDAEARFREQLQEFFGNTTPQAIFL